MKKLISLVLSLVVITTVATSLSVNVSAAGKVKLSNTSITLVVGKSKKLKLKNTSQKATWSSSKASVAKVDSNGKVTAKKQGTAKITAKLYGKKYTCKVKVVKKFALNNSSLKVISYNSKNLGYSGGYGKIKWTSSNKRIATVNNSGKITGLTPGSCTIKATRNGVTKSCKIIVQPNFLRMYDAYCDYEIADVGLDNSYLSLDSDPYDIGTDSDDYYDIVDWLYYDDLFMTSIEYIHKAMGLPESLLIEIDHTSARDGKQIRNYPDKGFSVSWTYSTNYGLEVVYKLI